MTQTAVEWFYEQITNKVGYYSEEVQQEIYQQAKAMEKEIIRKAYLDGIDNEYTTSEQYYNETFKSE